MTTVLTIATTTTKTIVNDAISRRRDAGTTSVWPSTSPLALDLEVKGGPYRVSYRVLFQCGAKLSCPFPVGAVDVVEGFVSLFGVAVFGELGFVGCRCYCCCSFWSTRWCWNCF